MVNLEIHQGVVVPYGFASGKGGKPKYQLRVSCSARPYMTPKDVRRAARFGTSISRVRSRALQANNGARKHMQEITQGQCKLRAQTTYVCPVHVRVPPYPSTENLSDCEAFLD